MKGRATKRRLMALVVGVFAAGPLASSAEDAEALWVVVHPDNPTESLQDDDLFEIFTRNQRFWPNRTPVVALNAPTQSSLRIRFDEAVLRMSSLEAGRFWIDQRVRGKGLPPRKVPRPDVAVRVVRRLRGAIAYVPAGTCLGGVKVVATIDRDGGVTAPPAKEEASRCMPRQ